MTRKINWERGAKILLLTDRPVLAEAIRLALDHGAFYPQVSTASDQAVDAVDDWLPHLAIIDLDVADAERVLERLQHTASGATRVPVVALTLRTDLNSRLAAFNKGVDDVLTLPFAPEELLARVAAVMRRTYRTVQPLSPTLMIGRLKIDIANRTVQDRGDPVHLTSVELALLYLLAANVGATLSRDEIIEHLWGIDYIAGSNLVDRHIGELRAKLKCDWRQPTFIQTVRGRGYQFMVAR